MIWANMAINWQFKRLGKRWAKVSNVPYLIWNIFCLVTYLLKPILKKTAHPGDKNPKHFHLSSVSSISIVGVVLVEAKTKKIRCHSAFILHLSSSTSVLGVEKSFCVFQNQMRERQAKVW